MQRKCQHQLLRIGIVGVLSLLNGGLLWDAIAPAPVEAYVSRANAILEVQPDEPFQTFVSRAETVARAAVQRSFDAIF